MGKSELAKVYAKKNEKKYTNIIHLFYDGDLKKCVAQMEFSDDTTDMSEDMLLDRHMKPLKKLHSDSLIIIDNFNVLPKEDAFFKEFILASGIMDNYLRRDAVEKFLTDYEQVAEKEGGWFWHRQNKALQYFNLLTLVVWWEEFVEGHEVKF